MTRDRVVLPHERAVFYVGSSKRDLDTFPEPVRKEIATALEVARLGGKHESAKPWKGLGPQLFEIVQDDGDAYRAVYTVQYREAVYVLHAFQKKSTQGIKTPKREIETVRARLKRAAEDYRERYRGKKERG